MTTAELCQVSTEIVIIHPFLHWPCAVQDPAERGQCRLTSPALRPGIGRCLVSRLSTSDGGPADSGASEGTRFHQLELDWILREFLASMRVEMFQRIVREFNILFITPKIIQFTRQNTGQMVLACLSSFVCWPLKVSKYPVQSRDQTLIQS